MIRTLTAVVLGTTILGLSRCIIAPHEIRLAATPPPTLNTQTGTGVKLKLAVIDDRGQRAVGQRGIGIVGADITAPDIMNHLTRQVTDGFSHRGFLLVSDSSQADALVTVSLRSFRWEFHTAFFVGQEDIYVALKAEGRKPATQAEFLKTYQYDNITPAIIDAHGAEISAKMDAGLQSVLAQFFSDSDLMNFLTKK